MARRPKKPKTPETDNNYQDKFSDEQKLKGEHIEENKMGNQKPNTANSYNKNGNKGQSGGSSNCKSINTGAANPIEMHSLSEAYLKPIGKLPEIVRSGYPLSRVSDAGLFNTSKIGGVLVMKYIPTAGDMVDGTSGANVGCTTLFNAVRAATSGTQYFEAPDLGIYNIAYASLLGYYAAMCRIYGTLKAYEVRNMYVPEGILEAHGIDWQDLSAKSEDFRSWINLWGFRIAQLQLPTGLQYVNRQVWLNSNVYMDSSVTESQLYMFVPMAFFQLQEGITAHTLQYYKKKQVKSVDADLWFLKLVAAPWTIDGVSMRFKSSSDTTKLAGFEALRAFGDSLWEPINNSQDCKYISAAYEKAFNSFYELNPIAEEYKVKPVYNEAVLAQIENATTLPGQVFNYCYVIQENVAINTGWLEGRLSVLNGPQGGSRMFAGLYNTIASTAEASSKVTSFDALSDNLLKETTLDTEMLNLHGEQEMTPEFVMESTRLISGTLDPTPLTVTSASDEMLYSVNDTTSTNTNLSVYRQWYRVYNFAANTIIGYDFTVLDFKNENKPWQGVRFDAVGQTLMTDMILVSDALRLDQMYNSFSSAASSIERGYFLSIAAAETSMASLYDVINILSQWDWHPRIRIWIVDYTSGMNVVEQITLTSEILDLQTYGLLSAKQLRELNDYDMLTQFSCAQAGDWNAQ